MFKGNRQCESNHRKQKYLLSLQILLAYVFFLLLIKINSLMIVQCLLNHRFRFMWVRHIIWKFCLANVRVLFALHLKYALCLFRIAKVGVGGRWKLWLELELSSRRAEWKFCNSWWKNRESQFSFELSRVLREEGGVVTRGLTGAALLSCISETTGTPERREVSILAHSIRMRWTSGWTSRCRKIAPPN